MQLTEGNEQSTAKENKKAGREKRLNLDTEIDLESIIRFCENSEKKIY
jgi:hypothetical protein